MASLSTEPALRETSVGYSIFRECNSMLALATEVLSIKKKKKTNPKSEEHKAVRVHESLHTSWQYVGRKCVFGGEIN